MVSVNPQAGTDVGLGDTVELLKYFCPSDEAVYSVRLDSLE